MKYLLIFLFLFNFALFSKEKKSIYVYKILTKNTKDPNFESKFRNKMTGILLKDFSDYNLMDDDSIAGLKAKLEKSKMFGCNEEACMREISRSLNADEVITGSIEENNGKFKYSFKNSARVIKGEENLSIKSLADGEFYLNQWEYFTGEIVRKLMNPSYAMNYKDAPLFENLDDFNYTTVKDLKEIKLPEIKGTTLDIAKLVKDTVANGDAAYQKKDYLLALNSFRDARDTLASISSEDRKKTGNLGDEVQNRIYLAGDALFTEKLNELDTYYKENSPMSLKAINRGKGLEGWKSLYGEYGKELKEGERNPNTEKRIVKNIKELSERKFKFLMEEEEKSGDEKLAKGKYDSAISYYEDALEIVRKSDGALGEKERSQLNKKLEDARAKRWNPEMEELYAKIEKKSEELWKDGEYPDYIEYLKEKVNKLYDVKDKGGTKSELVSLIINKINKYGERLKAEQKLISERISLYGDAARVDESFNKKIEREREKEVLRSAQLESFLYPRRFDPPFLHFPGSPQAEMHRYKYGTSGFKSSVYAYASLASFLAVGVGMVQSQERYNAYLRKGDVEPSVYYTLSSSDRADLSFLLLYLDRENFNRSFDKRLESAELVNGGISFFGFLILLSNFDLSLSTKTNDSTAKKSGIPLYNFEKGSLGINAKMSPFSSIQKYMGSEMQYNLEYSYQF
jgi:hypothetical protein